MVEKDFTLLVSLICIVILNLGFVSAFDFTGYVLDTDGSTAVAGANVTIKDPFSSIGGEPWSALTDSNGFFNVSGVNDSAQATYSVTIFNNATNYSNLKVGPMIPPMPKQSFDPGMLGPGGLMSLNNLSWTLREGALINITAFNATADISFGGEIKDKKIDWPVAGWYEATDYVTEGLVYVSRGRNYTVTLWTAESPPRAYLVSPENVSNGIHQLRVNTSTSLVVISGYLVNSSAVDFTRIRGYWLIGGDTVYLGDQSSIDGDWAPRFVNPTTGFYNHTVPSNVEILLCGYANSSVYYESCTNVTVGTSNINNLNLTLAALADNATLDTASEPNTTKVTFNLFKKFNNGTADTNQSLGRSYLKVKTTYGGKDIWWGVETNTSGSVKIPIQNNTNITVKLFVNDAPPRNLGYNSVMQSSIDIYLESMDQMVDDQGNALDAISPSFYTSNSSCDLPDATGGCIALSFTNTSTFNPFQLMTLGGNISVRLTLPSGVVLHFINVDILAGEPDVHKPTQSANTSSGGAVTEVWKFGSLIPREMYERVLVGVPYNTTLISEDQDFRLLVKELFNIGVDGTWTVSWNSSGDPNATNIPSYYQDFSNLDLFNSSIGGILCSKTNTSADCYVDLANDKVWFKIDHFSGLGPSVSSYAALGNITSDDTVYSCWKDSTSTQGCSALINLTVLSNSPLVNQIFNITLNNTADVSGLSFTIEWKNSSGDWTNYSDNHTVLTNFNLTATTHEFRINITLPYAVSTKWNITFNINGTNYTLDPYLDSINLTNPPSGNLTTDQTPNFNFTLYSDNWTTQNCELLLSLNGTGTWTAYGTNSTSLNLNSTGITANATISEGNYSWLISCNVTGNSTTRWIYIDDTTVPLISGISSSAGSSTATITWTTNENANSTITYGTTNDLGSINATSSSTASHSVSLSGLSESTTYYYNVTSCDGQGNCNTTGTNSFATSASTSTTTSGGSSATSFWTTTYTVTDEQFAEGFSKKLSKKHRFKVKVEDLYHYVGVVALTTSKVTINVTSDPQQATLSVGQEEKFEVTDDNYYDILVTLNAIESNKANLTVKSIHEEIPIEAEEETSEEEVAEITEETTEEETTEPEEEKSSVAWIVIIILIIVAVIAAVIYILYKELYLKKRYYKKGH